MKLTIMADEQKAIVIETQHSEQIATVQRDVAQLGSRFDRHLEIYAQNGKELQGVKINVANLGNDIRGMTDTLKDLDKKFVTQDQFWPVKTITYALIGTVCLAVLGAVLSYVIFDKNSQASQQAQLNAAASQAAVQAVQEVLQNYQSQVK